MGGLLRGEGMKRCVQVCAVTNQLPGRRKKNGSCLQRLTPNSLSLAKIKYGSFDVQQFSAILKDWSDSPNYVRLRNAHLETWNAFTATWLSIHSHPEEQITMITRELSLCLNVRCRQIFTLKCWICDPGLFYTAVGLWTSQDVRKP